MRVLDFARRFAEALMLPSTPRDRIDVEADLKFPARHGLGVSVVCLAAEYTPTPGMVMDFGPPREAWNTFRVAASVDGQRAVTSISREQLTGFVENLQAQVAQHGRVMHLPPLPNLGSFGRE
jgi:hypothetical protein